MLRYVYIYGMGEVIVFHSVVVVSYPGTLPKVSSSGGQICFEFARYRMGNPGWCLLWKIWLTSLAAFFFSSFFRVPVVSGFFHVDDFFH